MDQAKKNPIDPRDCQTGGEQQINAFREFAQAPCGTDRYFPNPGASVKGEGEYYAEPRDLIQRRLDKLNTQVQRLNRLYRSLPEDMNLDARKALCDLMTQAWGL